MKVTTIRGIGALAGGLVLTLGVGLSGLSCNKADKSDSASSGGGSGSGGEQVALVGAGSSFDGPIFNQWFTDYHAKHSNVVIEYQGIGSGGGIKQFTAGTVDFGASDAGMSDAEVGQVKTGGVVQLPVCAGAVVLSYNLAGVESLKLPRDVYPAIFLGKIKKWNDPAITAANPGVNLPADDIHVITRADGSGTTYVFTLHMSAVSPDWKAGPGTGKTVNFPVGVGGKQTDGVTALIKQTAGSIGYIEYGYAVNNKLPMAELQNKAGKYVKASPESGSAALASIDLPANLLAFAPDPAGDDSYPIVSYSWLLCHQKYDDAAKGKALKDVINYALTDGRKDSVPLGYIPLPEPVVAKVKAAADGIKAGG